MHLVRQIYNKAPPPWFVRRYGAAALEAGEAVAAAAAGEEAAATVEAAALWRSQFTALLIAEA